MAKPNLEVIRKNRDAMNFMSSFMKNKGVVNEWAFVWTKVEKEPQRAVYQKFFGKSPKVKLQYIDKFKKAAERVLAARLKEAYANGLTGADAIQQAIDGEEFPQILGAAQRYVRDQFTNFVMPEFFASTYWKNYVGTQVDGSSIAAKLNFPAKAGQDLADAKVALLLGDKSIAKSCVDLAIKKHSQEKLSKKDAARKGFRELKTADVLKDLEKIKITLI